MRHREEFDAVQRYIITKAELQGRVISFNGTRLKIVWCPVCIDSPKYERNALMFNLCFVFDANKNTLHFESVVKKLSGYLTTLENESGFLSSEETKQRIPSLLREILEQLNKSGTCCIPINESTTIHLKVVPFKTEPPMVIQLFSFSFFRSVASSNTKLLSSSVLVNSEYFSLATIAVPYLEPVRDHLFGFWPMPHFYPFQWRIQQLRSVYT